MIGVRTLENFYIVVSWDSSKEDVVIETDGKTLSFGLNSSSATFNGQEIDSGFGIHLYSLLANNPSGISIYNPNMLSREK